MRVCNEHTSETVFGRGAPAGSFDMNANPWFAGLPAPTLASAALTSTCFTVQVGPATVQTCTNSDATQTVQSCLQAGPSVSIAGVGVGITGQVCSTTSSGGYGNGNGATGGGYSGAGIGGSVSSGSTGSSHFG